MFHIWRSAPTHGLKQILILPTREEVTPTVSNLELPIVTTLSARFNLAQSPERIQILFNAFQASISLSSILFTSIVFKSGLFHKREKPQMSLEEISPGALDATDLELGAILRIQSGFDSSRSSLDEEYCQSQSCDVHIHDDVSIDDPDEVAKAYSCHRATDSDGVLNSHEPLRQRLQVRSLYLG